MHFTDTGLFYDAVIALLWIAICTVVYIRDRRWRRRRSYLNGWWHYQHPDDGKRAWNPSSWANACDKSLEKARARRG